MDMVFVLYDKMFWFVVHGCLLVGGELWWALHVQGVWGFSFNVSQQRRKIVKRKRRNKVLEVFAYPTNKRESKRKREVGCFRFNHNFNWSSLLWKCLVLYGCRFSHTIYSCNFWVIFKKNHQGNTQPVRVSMCLYRIYTKWAGSFVQFSLRLWVTYPGTLVDNQPFSW